MLLYYFANIILNIYNLSLQGYDEEDKMLKYERWTQRKIIKKRKSQNNENG